MTDRKIMKTYMQPEDAEKVEELAAKRGLSVSALIRVLLMREVREGEGK